ncbi:hypothetical protein [Pseudoduganella namucuonensis]|uniref:hypothetical protein n=1 Tax=Pseudoduganella namucuonensis TaxID=1035707 RepID=UPI000B8189F0|nr:hypothetical protein [Pseudoduganella namucuonensis]
METQFRASATHFTRAAFPAGQLNVDLFDSQVSRTSRPAGLVMLAPIRINPGGFNVQCFDDGIGRAWRIERHTDRLGDTRAIF